MQRGIGLRLPGAAVHRAFHLLCRDHLFHRRLTTTSALDYVYYRYSCRHNKLFRFSALQWWCLCNRYSPFTLERKSRFEVVEVDEVSPLSMESNNVQRVGLSSGLSKKGIH